MRRTLLPSGLMDAGDADWRECILGPVATDTETSGLYADSGARVSTASVAFEANSEEPWNDYSNVTEGWEEVAPGQPKVYIVSVAWPFDQGTEGKPEFSGQPQLWPEAENLNSYEWRSLLQFLDEAPHGLVMHNAKFDLEKYRVGVRRWPEVGHELESKVIWDTQNVNDLLWRLHPTSLKPTCARIFGQEWADEADVVKKYLAKSKLPTGRWDLIPWEVIEKYADTDARITLMLFYRQLWEINENRGADWLWSQAPEGDDGGPYIVDQYVNRRLEVMDVLYRMERRGVTYDEVTSREAGIECRSRAKNVAETLPFNPQGEEARKFFFSDGKTSKGVECLDHVPYSVTEKGKPSLTAEIVKRMVADDVPHAAKYDEYNRVTNAASMWYEGYADAMGTDGRLRTCFRQNGTRSSRFSVERVNLQAIPQDYRLSDHSALDGILTPRQIIAKAVADLEGSWRIFELDLAQAELRIATMFAKCKTMYDMIVAGEDMHGFTTKALFPKIKFEGPQWAEYRQVGKRGNFSLCFGSGGTTFRAMVSKETGILLGEDEANRIVRDWRGLYPEFQRAIDRHSNVVARRQGKHKHGWLDAVNGERRWFQPYEEAHKAFNQRVQLNLGQFAIDWMLKTEELLSHESKLQKKAAKDGIGEPGLLLTIHDSQVLLLPDNQYGKDLATQCAQFGKDLWPTMFPGIPGDVDYHEWSYSA